MVAQRQIADAAGALRLRPAQAAATLDSAAQFFDDLDIPLLALPAKVNGAQAHLIAGDMAHGMVRLEAALAILEQRRDSIRVEPRRAAVFEAARSVVDRVAMLQLAMGDTAAALAYLDRGRASLAAVGPAEAASAARIPTGPPGEVAVEFGLVNDTLLAWTVTEQRVELHRAVVDTTRLIRTIESLRSLLEARADEAAVRPALSQLYEWLIRPFETRLGGAGTPLVVIADGDLASVPFAALYDARRNRYLVERHPMRFVASLREARRRSLGAAGAEALFIADPAYNATQSPGFERLRVAAVEAGEIAAEYPRARVLRDTGANAETLRARLARARLMHYAGHAVFDDERPERSYLLLAGADRLQAGEIVQLDLRHVSLVVLAACQTVRTGRGRAAGFSGLAGAFLAAGAGGAVGSLWEVDDQFTRPLMVEFHRAYRGSSNGPSALRTAQLRLLQSENPALRSPSAWAGFRYAGR
jgi:CHAT domain-containing protein